MLRIVHPAPAGKATRPPRGRHAPALSLTVEETRHLRAATRNAVRAYGGVDALATATGIPRKTLYSVTSDKGPRPSAAVALRIAHAAGSTVEAILSGQLAAAGACPRCGAVAGGGAR